MPFFESYDGTRLAYHISGTGDALVCLPGGPGRASRYLGDLGGLSAHRTLIRLDLRGTGDSAIPEDPGTYRCDRQVADVEALREHLGLADVGLLGHSAAANLAILYAAAHPDRVNRLVLLAPGARAAGVDMSDEEWRVALAKQSGEPWYPDAYAAIMAWDAGEDTRENRQRAAPLFYGRWDEAARAHAGTEFEQRAAAMAAGYYAEGAFDPERTRARLARLRAPVLVVAGEIDPAPTPAMAGEVAKLFPAGELAVIPGAGHYPWVTHPAELVRTLTN